MKTAFVFVLSVLVILLLPLVQMTWRIFPPQRMFGVRIPEVPVPLTLDSFIKRTWQTRLEGWFNQNYGFYDYLVKTNNQILYSVFGHIENAEGMMMGNNCQLLRRQYTEATLQYHAPLDFTRIVVALEELHVRFQARGIALLVLITPSKTSIYPEYIPDQYMSRPHGILDADYDSFVRSLSKTNVPVVDGVAMTKALAHVSVHPLFPEGGIHWNIAAVFPVAQELLSRIRKVTGRTVGYFKDYKLAYDYTPTGADVDYALLLNLWVPPTHFEGVHETLVFSPGPDANKLVGIFTGASFNSNLIDLFSAYKVFGRIFYVEYNARVMEYPYKEAAGPQSQSLADAGLADRVLKADFVIVEVNQAVLGNSDSPDGFGFGILRTLKAILYAKEPPKEF